MHLNCILLLIYTIVYSVPQIKIRVEVKRVEIAHFPKKSNQQTYDLRQRPLSLPLLNIIYCILNPEHNENCSILSIIYKNMNKTHVCGLPLFIRTYTRHKPEHKDKLAYYLHF